MALLAITGPAGSGKSTASQVLLDAGWHRVKMAGALKDMARCFFRAAGIAPGDIEACIEGPIKETPLPELMGQTPRHVMQTLGTEWGRTCIHADVWTELARAQIVHLMQQGKSVVVDDCRFANEAALIRSLGGLVLALEGRGGLAGSHESEQGLAGDITYRNVRPLADLQSWMRYVFLMADQ